MHTTVTPAPTTTTVTHSIYVTVAAYGGAHAARNAPHHDVAEPAITVSPKHILAYAAKACSGPGYYHSACWLWGLKPHTSTRTTPVRTKTITVSVMMTHRLSGAAYPADKQPETVTRQYTVTGKETVTYEYQPSAATYKPQTVTKQFTVTYEAQPKTVTYEHQGRRSHNRE